VLPHGSIPSVSALGQVLHQRRPFPVPPRVAVPLLGVERTGVQSGAGLTVAAGMLWIGLADGEAG
jgi:hypothetical protein